MTTHSRIAAFLSTSALCLGLAAAPAASPRTRPLPGETKSQMEHTGKHHKADKTSAKPAAASPPPPSPTRWTRPTRPAR